MSGIHDRFRTDQWDPDCAASDWGMKWGGEVCGGVPGGGGGLSGLPLDLGLLAHLPPQGRLHLSWDVRGRLADLHGRLQQLHSAASVGLHF